MKYDGAFLYAVLGQIDYSVKYHVQLYHHHQESAKDHILIRLIYLPSLGLVFPRIEYSRSQNTAANLQIGNFQNKIDSILHHTG